MSLKKKAVASKTNNNLPRHLAIIMDGNGRWAKDKGLPRIAGHWSGAEALRRILEYCSEIGIEYLTVFAFSSENWKRPFREVKAILNLLLYYLKVEIYDLHKNHVRVVISGDWDDLPEKISVELKRCVDMTKENTGITLNIALNYGSRNEILEACKQICQSVADGDMTIDEINEESFGNRLYTSGMPDPDLLIRPSGELRISNFLLWQIAYTELWFTDVNWPDFTPDDIVKALEGYKQRDRRFGDVKRQNR